MTINRDSISELQDKYRKLKFFLYNTTKKPERIRIFRDLDKLQELAKNIEIQINLKKT
jgi:hypothetical protein